MIPVDPGGRGYPPKAHSPKKGKPKAAAGRFWSGVKVQRKTADAEISRPSRCANADDHLTQIARMSRIVGRAYPRDSPASSSEGHDPYHDCTHAGGGADCYFIYGVTRATVDIS